MAEKRFENRALCADVVQVEWKDKSGWKRSLDALLEDISPGGACLQTEVPVPVQTEVQVICGSESIEAYVRYCTYREIGYFGGLEFPKSHPWSRRLFRPKHMLDLGRLVR